MEVIKTMAKCMKCGKSTLVKGHVKLADGAICTPCFRSLGFKLGDVTTSSQYKYDDIKDGHDAMIQRRILETAARADRSEAEDLGITIKLVRQLDKAGATDPERRILGAICAVLADESRDIDVIDVALGDNGSLLLMIDGVVFIRYKSDAGVKWIAFENEGGEKIRITGPARINAMADRIVEAYDSAM